MRQEIGLLLVIVALPLGSLLASDGAVPLWEPTTITEPGSYVVTRDIAGVSGDTIAVTAHDVTIDLQGHTLSASGTNYCVRHTGTGNFTIRNGKIIAGEYGIYSSGAGVGSSITIEDIVVHGGFRSIRVIGAN